MPRRRFACTACAVALSGLVMLPGTIHAEDRLRSETPFSPRGPVYAFAQSSERLMFVGTSQGMVEWNGQVARPHFVPDPNSAWVYRLAADQHGAVWMAFGGSVAACVGTPPCQDEWSGAAGIARVQSGMSTRVASINDGRSEDVWALMAHPNGDLWAGTPHGLLRYRDGRPIRITPTVDGNPVFVTAIAHANNRILVGTTRGAFTLEADRLQSIGVQGVVADVIGVGEMVWVATRSGLWRVAPGMRPTRFGIAEGLPGEDVRGLAVGLDGTLWVATLDGLARLHDNQFQRVATPARDQRLLAIGRDDEGGIWIGSRTGDVARVYATPARNVGLEEGLRFRDVAAVAVGAPGNVWVLSRDGQVARVKDGVANMLVLPMDLQSCAKETLSAGGDEHVLIGTQGCGLWQLDASGQGGRVQGVTESDVQIIRITEHPAAGQAGLVYLANADGIGVYRLSPDAAGTSPVTRAHPIARWGTEKGRCKGAIADLAPRPDGEIWVAFANGQLAQTQSGGLRCLDWSDDVAGGRLSSLALETNGTLWLAARGYLLRYSAGTVRSFNEQDGLHCDDLAAVALDGADHLWMACHSGISRIDLAPVNAYVKGKSSWLEPLTFGRFAGLRSVEGSFRGKPAAALGGDGTFWVATADGLAGVLAPERVRYPCAPRMVSVETFVATGNPSEQGDVELIEGQELNLRANTVAMTLPAAQIYRYQLTSAGLPMRTLQAPAATVNLGRLLSGTYRIDTAVANAFGEWAHATAPIFVRVIPPWHARPLSWIGFAAALVFVVLSIQTVRRRRALATAMAIQAERDNLARDLHDTLGQGFSSLASHLDSAALHTQTDDPRSEMLARARSVVRHVQEDARRMMWRLRSADPSQVSLVDGLRELGVPSGEPGAVPCEVEVAAGLTAGDNRVDFELLQVAREAVTNARKHAHAHRIQVEARRHGTQLRLRISDDGIGMHVDAERAVTAGHFGMLGMQERVRRMGGTLEIDSTAESGTLIEVTVSLGQL